MTESEVGQIFLALGIVIAGAQLFGAIFAKLRQPRLIGEILTGVILGPYVLGKLAPSLSDSLFHNMLIDKHSVTAIVFGFMYWLGVMMLMLLSGSEVRELLNKQNRRATIILLSVGKTLPFLIVIGLGLLSVIPLDSFVGDKGVKISALLILASAVSVTSIPILSRIFQELDIMETRFAGLVLGAAVLEDVALWAVLAVATSYASAAHQSNHQIAVHVGSNIAYLVVALSLLPQLLGWLRKQPWNVLYQTNPTAYVFVLLSVYAGLAGAVQVNIIFAAFFAGFGIVGGARGTERKHFVDTFAVLRKISYAVLIPVYFAMVGYRLVFDRGFSIALLLAFLFGSSLIAITSVGLAAKLAGFRKHEIINLAITFNARGGPGIVIATIAYEAKIINASFYTTLVLTALISTQFAEFWLRRMLSRGQPLLDD